MNLHNRPIHVFYHAADLDGICSAAVVLAALPGDGPKAALHPIDYGDKFPWVDIREGAVVIMVDFSLSGEEMYELAELCRMGDGQGQLVWYDHHKTAIEAVDVQRLKEEAMGRPTAIAGLRDPSRAACEIVAAEMLLRTPLAVRLLGRYDMWDHGFCPNILEFQYGMRALELNPQSPLWRILLSREQPEFAESEMKATIRDGTAILRYARQERRRTVTSGAHVVRLGASGLLALACNAAGGSELFRDAPHDLLSQADLLMTYVWSGCGNAWRCGLYHKPGRTDVDCGALAKTFGGGGHKGAAGFRFDGGMVTFAVPK